LWLLGLIIIDIVLTVITLPSIPASFQPQAIGPSSESMAAYYHPFKQFNSSQIQHLIEFLKWSLHVSLQGETSLCPTYIHACSPNLPS
jgi:uncharacterized membrane protein